MVRQRSTPLWIWLLAGFGLLCVLMILDPFAIEIGGWVLFGLYVFCFALLPLVPLVLAFLAYFDLRRVAREGKQSRWEMIDVLWTVGFFVLPLIGPLVWFYGGRSTRERARALGA